MQNAPAMLGQKMMNRQAPYGPIGMVAQDMSGNKKGAAAGGGGGGVGVIGLVFDTTSASPGVTFSNSNITASNPSGPQTYASAKSSSGSPIGADTSFYFEFIVGNTLDQQFGFAKANFASNHSDFISQIVGGTSAFPSFAYRPSTGAVSYGGTGPFATIASATTGDVIGITVGLTVTACTINVFKNNVNLSTFNASLDIPGGYTNSYVPAWSSRAIGAFSTLSNSIFVQAGFTPLGSAPNTITASASVPAVPDGKYDVYTFNASGTFTAGSTGAVRALVIAGGGGSQGSGSGGAGAGGYQEKGIVATPQTYTITVGAGGSTGVGANSSVAAVVVSTGGGVGAPFGTKNGGSGGGAFRDTATNSAAGTGIAGQGFAGGTVTFTGGATAYSQAGGGGAGAVGGNGSITVGGNGGAGITSSITGTAVARGGGGAGASSDGALDYFGTATAGGGSSLSNINGTANTGGGAGPDGSGGSGVVIIRVRARA